MTSSSKRDAIRFFFDTWMEHKTLLQVILSSNHLEVLYRTFRVFSEDLGAIMHPEVTLSEEEEEYFVTVVSYVMVGILEVWMKHGEQCTAEELTDVLEKTLATMHHSFHQTGR